MKKLIFLMILIGILSINLVNAEKIKIDDKILIKNSGTNLVQFELIDNSYFCGGECYAVLKITVFEDGQKDILKDLKFLKKKNKNWEIEPYFYSFYFKIKTNYGWEGITFNNLKKELEETGTYYIKLIGEKNPKDSLDWIFNSYDYELDEWAIWGASYVYDEINDSILNDTLWLNDTTTPENNDYLELTASGKLTSSASYYVKSTNLSNINTIENLTIKVYTYTYYEAGGGGNGGSIAIFNAFGNEIKKYDRSTAGSDTDSSVWTFLRNDSAGTNKFDVYDDGVFLKQITASNNELNLSSSYTSSNGEDKIKTATTRFYYVYWVSREGFKFDIIAPANNSQYISGNNVTFSINNSLSINQLVNTTLYLNGLVNETTNISGQTNVTSFIKSIRGIDNFSFYSCDNNSNCLFTDTYDLIEGVYEENSQTYNASSYETTYESFILNLSYISDDWTSISANLNYDGTEYTSTKTGSGNTLLFTKNNVRLANNIGNNTFYWNISMTNSSGTFYYQSTSYNQSVAPIIFGLCNSTLNQTFLNFSFKDEDNLSIVSAKIPSSTWFFWLNDVTYNKTYYYQNSTANLNYGFCFEPIDRILNLNYNIQYANEGYPQRISSESTTFSNATTNKTLYLTSSSDGIYVTFQVTNTADQLLKDTEVTVDREINGVDTRIGSGFTNDGGTITFWLNPNYQHTFSFSKSGYDSYTTSFYPTNNEYTVQLGGGTSIDDDYTIGISYTITPQNFTLVNDTDYNFSLTLDSSYWELDGFGFILYNGSGTYLDSESSTNSQGGTLSMIYNTASHESFTLDYYYIINGTYVNYSRSWVVYDSAGAGWSIFQFFTNLSATLNSGFFGLDNFGIAIIIFIFILGFTAALSYKFGISSPAAIMGFIWAFVLFLDIGVGLIPADFIIGAVPHFISILVSLILIGFIIREIQK